MLKNSSNCEYSSIFLCVFNSFQFFSQILKWNSPFLGDSSIKRAQYVVAWFAKKWSLAANVWRQACVLWSLTRCKNQFCNEKWRSISASSRFFDFRVFSTMAKGSFKTDLLHFLVWRLSDPQEITQIFIIIAWIPAFSLGSSRCKNRVQPRLFFIIFNRLQQAKKTAFSDL